MPCQILDQLFNLLSLKMSTPEELLTWSEDSTSIYAPSVSKQQPSSSRSPSEEAGGCSAPSCGSLVF